MLCPLLTFHMHAFIQYCSPTALSIIGNDRTYIMGFPVELICTSKEENISRMEWTTGLDVPIVSANHTISLALTVNTSEILTSAAFYCRVTTHNGLQFTKYTTIRVRGN